VEEETVELVCVIYQEDNRALGTELAIDLSVLQLQHPAKTEKWLG